MKVIADFPYLKVYAPMHFVITGGAGFIGSHIVELLLQEEHEVTVIDNLRTGRLGNLPQHPHLNFLERDINTCQPQDFSKPIDGIAHLAAIPSVVESWQQPMESHHSNLSATLNLIQLCRELHIPKLVFASSAAVYGTNSRLSVSEKDPTVPIAPYGLQKLVSEQYANLFAEQFGFSLVVFRMFNVFGQRQVPGSPYSGVISIFVDAMKRGLPIRIFGDGTQTRDFVYVADVAAAYVRALTIPLTPGTCITCNLGTGKSISLLQLIDVLRVHFPQWQLEPEFQAVRMGDIKHSQANISQAHMLLGFTPQWSVEAGMEMLLESSG